MIYHTSQQAGFSLVETLVAISVLMLALVGPIVIAAKGLQTSYYAREQITALYLAQEGVEAVTELRNSHYIDFIRTLPASSGNSWNWIGDSTLSPCFESDGCGFGFARGDYILGQSGRSFFISPPVSCSDAADCVLELEEHGNGPLFTTHPQTSGGDSRFTRVVQIDNSDSNAVVVTSTVSWETPLFDADQQVVLTSVLYDYLQDF